MAEDFDDDGDLPDLGPCCMCDGRYRVRTIITLNRRCEVPGHGWGCIVCRLPADGACAVLCDDCYDVYQRTPEALTVACRGYPAENGRCGIADLDPEPFEHDESKHRNEALLIGEGDV
jgi:hypothetical protein